jgi:hypothetical protein
MNNVVRNRNLHEKKGILQPRPRNLYKGKSNEKQRSKQQRLSIPVKRLSVQYAHTCVSRLLHKEGTRKVKITHGKDVVRICSRTVGQLQHTTPLLKELLQYDYIEEIGMPLDYAYKMKSLVLFIKPIDAECSKKIECFFRNSGFNFHITVFDVKNPNPNAMEGPTVTVKHLGIPVPKLKIVKNVTKQEEKKTQLKIPTTNPNITTKVTQPLAQNVTKQEEKNTADCTEIAYDVIKTLAMSMLLAFFLYTTHLTWE